MNISTKALAVAALSFVGVALAAEPKVTDAQIAAIVVAANQVDIDAGKFAADKTKSEEVKTFAQMMVTDHTSVNKSAVDLVTKLKVSPEENDTSRALKAGGEKNVAELRGLTGKAFDRAYVDHEVAYHEQVIQALDTVLVPNAQNGELKALLVKVRPAFLAHLEHAKHLQASLR
jgi:putative membrane protein